jgi:peptide/nickel transport system substrate-binding protein
LLFVGCTVKQNKTHKTAFRYNESKGISSLDPAFAKTQTNIWPVHQLYNGLVQIGQYMDIEPSIAKSWQVLDSGLTYRFILRDDVYFHKHHLFGKDSTRNVTAYDFVYSLNRIVDPEVASPVVGFFPVLTVPKGITDFPQLMIRFLNFT